MANKMQAISGMNTRQKVTALAVTVVVLIVLWEIWGLFGSGAEEAASIAPTPAKPLSTAAKSGTGNMTPGGGPASSGTPQSQTQLPQPAMTPQMAEVMKQQQDNEARYLQAVNQLQLLKVARDIANNNRDIMRAKLDAVMAQKKIVDTLTTPTTDQQGYAQSLVNPKGTAVAPPVVVQEVSYTVVSVTELQNRWSAVLGSQGNLYSVHVGDVLPGDGSTVVSISRSGVVLEKDGVQKKISIVSII